MTRICFVSYEIFPTTWGGAGVLLYNAARFLLENRHEIIFLLDIPNHEFHQFQDLDRLRFPNPQHCRAYQVDSLCEDMRIQVHDFDSLAAWKAYRFDYACQKVALLENPDLIEFFDYCGVAYYSLINKITGFSYRDSHIVIRLHNTTEIIDFHGPDNFLDDQTYQRHAFEHGALRLSETVIYPSKSYLDEACLPHYEPWFGQLARSTPPLIDYPKFARPADPQADIVLLYSRLYAFKGVDRFVDAAVIYLNTPGVPELIFYLVGHDSMKPPLSGFSSYQEYLWSKIPDKYRGNFIFTGILNWEVLGELLPRVKFAVFANYFESFCYSAHELYAAGVPLIVSNIPAFRDYFKHEENALVFDGSIKDLIQQMTRLSNDSEMRKKISFPYPLSQNPLNGFYDQIKPHSWINLEQKACKIRLLLCIIVDKNSTDDLVTKTLSIIDQASVSNVEIVLLVESKKSSESQAVWMLGGLYVLQDRERGALEINNVKTADSILILRTGDILEPSFLSCGLNVLTHQPEITFVGSWKKVSNGSENHLQTFPLDLMPELIPFRGIPPLNRCIMRTRPDDLLIDLFDHQAGIYGELAYLWKLDVDHKCGITIPKPLINICDDIPSEIPPKIFSYLVSRYASQRLKSRLARYSVTLQLSRIRDGALVKGQNIQNKPYDPLSIDIEHNDVYGSVDWRLMMVFRKFRRKIRQFLEENRFVQKILLKPSLWIWDLIKKSTKEL